MKTKNKNTRLMERNAVERELLEVTGKELTGLTGALKLMAKWKSCEVEPMH